MDKDKRSFSPGNDGNSKVEKRLRKDDFVPAGNDVSKYTYDEDTFLDSVKKLDICHHFNIPKELRINYKVHAEHLIGIDFDYLQKSVLSRHQSTDDKFSPKIDELTKLPLCFSSYESYLYCYYPVMMLEIWEQLCKKSEDIIKGKTRGPEFHFCLSSCLPTRTDCNHTELECESIVSEKVSDSLRGGTMVILEFDQNETETSHKCLGYIKKSEKSEKLDMSVLTNPAWKNLSRELLTDGEHWKFTIWIKKTDESFSVNILMKGTGICYMKNILRLAQALNELKHSSFLNDILNPTATTFSVRYSEPLMPIEGYSLIQSKAINGICSEITKSEAEPKIILLQGPPGTGKTRTLIGIIKKIVYEDSMRILVVAPSNAAVDEMECRLIELNQKARTKKNINFVRVGVDLNKNNIKRSENMSKYFLDKMVRDYFEEDCNFREKQNAVKIKKLEKEISFYENGILSQDTKQKLTSLRVEIEEIKKQTENKDMDDETKKRIMKQILLKCNIVLSTLHSCAPRLMRDTFVAENSFKCCIVDESAQCTEIDSLQPLMFSINKLILAGDHKQLSATVTSEQAKKYEFGRSLFERLHWYFDKKSPIFTLTTQHRMDPAICRFPSQKFYGGKLITAPEIAMMNSEYSLNPYVVLNITDGEESGSVSKRNINEASVVVDVCKCLVDVVDSTAIGIITFYQAQQEILEHSKIENSQLKDIEINTVDAFQGREKDVIILSCVRAGQSDKIGFVSSKQRLNVAITRAKKCLIICCHVSTLKKCKVWGSLIEDATNREVLFHVASSEDISSVFEKNIKKQN